MASEDEPTLSDATMRALQEFLQEQVCQHQKEEARNSSSVREQEDWQLSQFWYNDETAGRLAQEAIKASEGKRIACLSCPTLYSALVKAKPDSCEVKLFEFDKRFAKYESDFVFYDYNQPLELSGCERNSFDLVAADPPFLSEECLTKTAVSIKFLTKGKILLNTGAVMEDLAARLLGVKPCNFIPKHERQLGNQFRCFVNYDSDL